MDDETRVSVLHRAEHLKQQVQALVNIQLRTVAVRRDRRSGYVLQRQVRLPVLRKAGIKQSRDVGMAEARQNFALACEPLRHAATHQRRMHELESNLAREQSIGSLSQPHTAHSTPTKQRQDAIGAEVLPRERLLGLQER